MGIKVGISLFSFDHHNPLSISSITVQHYLACKLIVYTEKELYSSGSILV